MKKMKLFLLFFLVLTIAIGGSGCMMISNENTVIKYLQEKYNDEFFVDELISAGLDTRYDEYYCHSKQYPDEKFHVYYDGKEFKDNYYGIIVRTRYYDIITSIIDNYIKNYKLYFSFSNNFFDSDVVDISQFENYLKDSPEQFFSNVYVYIDDTASSEIDYDAMCDELLTKLKNLYVSVNVINYTNFNALNENNYLKADANNIFCKTIK